MIVNGEEDYPIYSLEDSKKNNDLDFLDTEENIKINKMYPYGQSSSKVINLIPKVSENENTLEEKINVQNNLIKNYDKKNLNKSETNYSNISSIPFPSQDIRVNSNFNTNRSFSDSYENSSRSSILRNGLNSERSQEETKQREISIKKYLQTLEKSLTRRNKDFISVNEIDGGQGNLINFNTFNSISDETIANEKYTMRTFDFPSSSVRLKASSQVLKSSSRFGNKTFRNNSLNIDKFKQFELSPQISTNKTYKNLIKILGSDEYIKNIDNNEYNQQTDSYPQIDITTRSANKKFLNELKVSSDSKNSILNSSGNILLNNLKKDDHIETSQSQEKNISQDSEKNLQVFNNMETNYKISDLYKCPTNTPRIEDNEKPGKHPIFNEQLDKDDQLHWHHHKKKKRKSKKPLNQKDPLYKIRPQKTDDFHDERTGIKQFKNVYDSMDDDEDENKLHYLIDENFKSDPWVFTKDSKFRKCWSFFIIILIVYSITVSPVKIAFYEETTTINYMELTVDCLFILDVILNFFTPYKDEDSNLIGNHRMIVVEYMQSWFFFDLISCFPTDLLTYTFEKSDTSTFQLKKIIRLSRLYRLGRWLKVLRFIKLAKDADNFSSINFVHGLEVNRLISFGVVTIMLIHISSCIWIYIAQINEDYDNWIHRSFFELNKDNFSLYIASFYFTFCTVSTIGYGDIISYSLLERVYNIVLLIVGVILFSFCLSALSSIFSKIDEKAINLQNKISTLEAIQKEYNIPKDLINKIRKTIKHEIKKTNIERYEFIESLPTAIKSQIFLVIHKNHIKHLYFFKGHSYDFILYVLPLFKSQPLTKSDVLFSIGEFVEEMYLVTQGVLSLNLGPVYDHMEIAQIRKGNHIGDVLLYLHEQSPYDLRCISDNTEVLVIKRSDFFKIKLHFNSNILYILQNSMKKMELFEKRRMITTTLRKYETDPKIINLKLKKLNLMLLYKEYDSFYNPDGQYTDIYESLDSISHQEILNLMGIDQSKIDALNNIKIEISDNKNKIGGINKMGSGVINSGLRSVKTLSFDDNKTVQVQGLNSNTNSGKLLRSSTSEKQNGALENEKENLRITDNREDNNSVDDKNNFLSKQSTLRGKFKLKRNASTKGSFDLTTNKTIKSEKKHHVKKIINEILFVNLLGTKTKETLNSQIKGNDIIDPILNFNCKNSIDQDVDIQSKSGISTPHRRKSSAHYLNLGLLKEELEEVKKAGELGQENAENLHIKKIKENIDVLKKFKRKKTLLSKTGKSSNSSNSVIKLQNINCDFNDKEPNKILENKEIENASPRCNSSIPNPRDCSFVDDENINKSLNGLDEKEEINFRKTPKKKLSQHYIKDGNNININFYQYETNYNQNYIFLNNSNSNLQNNSSEYPNQKEFIIPNNLNINVVKSDNTSQISNTKNIHSLDELDYFNEISSNNFSQNIKRSSSLGDISIIKSIPIHDYKLKFDNDNENENKHHIETTKYTNGDILKFMEVSNNEKEFENRLIYFTQPCDNNQKDFRLQLMSSQRYTEKEINKNYKKVDRLYYYMQKMVSIKKQGTNKQSIETISSEISDVNI